MRRTIRALFIPSTVLAALACTSGASASNVGRHLPSEKRTVVDEATGVVLTFLTTDPANDAKPYQTHTTWTADGRWIIFRSDRAGSGPQAFLVNEQTGNIVQLTEGPTDTGSLNLSRKENALYYVRGGRSRDGRPETPRQLVRLQLDPLLADALAGTPKDATAYEGVIATLPSELRDAGGFALDADESQPRPLPDRAALRFHGRATRPCGDLRPARARRSEPGSAVARLRARPRTRRGGSRGRDGPLVRARLRFPPTRRVEPDPTSSSCRQRKSWSSARGSTFDPVP